jgi:phosphoglucomutase
MTSLLDQLYQRDGRLVTRRIEIGLDKQREQRLREKLSRSLPEDLGGRRIVTIDRTDGIKFVFENESWVLLRISGTEPVARCYAEATSEAELEVLLEHGRRFALE